VETRISRRRREELAEDEQEQIAYEPSLPARPPLARSPHEAARAALAYGAGNHAVTRILARDPPKTIVKHKTGKEVDVALDASPYFKPLIATGVAQGKQAEGHVHIHDDAAFELAVFAYLSGKENPDTGKVFTDEEAKAFGKTVNAYADGREIHVHEERGEPGTTVHESMHLFSHATWLPEVGFNANEGTTEYFTKKLCAELSLKRGDFYADQHRAVKSLVEYVGETYVAEAYFNGKLDELEKAFDKKAGESVGTSVSNFFGSITGAEKKTGAGEFKKWLAYMKAGSYFLARMMT
jgi:hypothetical protein